MATLTVQKPNSRTIRVDINLDQWERLADVFGFYQTGFIKTLRKSLGESRKGRVKKIKSLRELGNYLYPDSQLKNPYHNLPHLYEDTKKE